MPVKLCCSCKTTEARPGQRTCGGCHAIYMRGWRALAKQKMRAALEELARFKAGKHARA